MVEREVGSTTMRNVEFAKKLIHRIVPDRAIQFATLRFRRIFSYIHVCYFQDFAFIHINKCGGTSVERAIGMYFVYHDTALQRRSKLGHRKWDSRLKFTVVRNPYDRVGSMFLYEHRHSPLSLQEARENFPAFIRKLRERQPPSARGISLNWTQTKWVSDGNGKILIDRAYHLETLKSEWGHVQELIPTAGPLPHYKKSSADFGPRAFYTEETADLIKDIFQEDFENFGYDVDFNSSNAPIVQSPVVFS